MISFDIVSFIVKFFGVMTFCVNGWLWQIPILSAKEKPFNESRFPLDLSFDGINSFVSTIFVLSFPFFLFCFVPFTFINKNQKST